MAASARGDERERSRLVVAAPQVSLQVPHYYGLAQAFREVADLHFMELLNLAALYFQGLGQADAQDEEEQMRALDAALLLGFLFKVNLAG
jgi:hypothetical protein